MLLFLTSGISSNQDFSDFLFFHSFPHTVVYFFFLLPLIFWGNSDPFHILFLPVLVSSLFFRNVLVPFPQLAVILFSLPSYISLVSSKSYLISLPYHSKNVIQFYLKLYFYINILSWKIMKNLRFNELTSLHFVITGLTWNRKKIFWNHLAKSRET